MFLELASQLLLSTARPPALQDCRASDMKSQFASAEADTLHAFTIAIGTAHTTAVFKRARPIITDHACSPYGARVIPAAMLRGAARQEGRAWKRRMSVFDRSMYPLSITDARRPMDRTR